MTADVPAHPASGEPWVVAILASENEFESPLGAAVLIAADRVLTCAHVIVGDDGKVRERLWVGFPRVSGSRPCQVVSWDIRYEPPIRGRAVRDLAVLTLEEPAPAGVEPAPLRCPAGGDLRGKRWWAFGFPDGDPVGDSADGQVGEALAHGWVRLDTTSRYLVRPGFSGGGMWSRDYQAVVGVVGQAHSNGDGRAITLREADLCLPGQKLAELARWSAEAAGELALNQWGWALSLDPEGVRHWLPRARGVSVNSERGSRFRGRRAALTRIVRWLGISQPDRSVLVVTGSPGVGKSAVLGRIVTTADPGIRTSLPTDDTAVRAEAGSVACAVHAKGKTALEVAEEIARAASAKLPEELSDLTPAIQAALTSRDHRPFSVIIDALDEAVSPAHARAIIDRVVLPLAETCADAGARLVVGTRRRDDAGDLLRRFGAARAVLDLDEPEYFAEEDLADYALACLQLAGDERPGNPYADDRAALPLADRIARMADGNFLITGLVARAHGLHDTQPANPAQLTFPATVDAALGVYLDRLSPVGGLPAASVLTALAFAEAPGLTAGLWRAAVYALYKTGIEAEELAAYARSAAANFLVESAGDSGGVAAVPGPRVYRLFHQALDDGLLRARGDFTPRADDERAITRAFLAHGQDAGWQNAPSYLLRALPGHAVAGNQIDDLLADGSYLLHADLRRLTSASYHAVTEQGRCRARLLRLTPEAIFADSRERAALFSVTEALERLGTTYGSDTWLAPYTARWASTPPRAEIMTLQGHRGAVNAVCTIAMVGRDLLASGGDDGTVRVWDLDTGELVIALGGHRGAVNAVCPVTVAGWGLLAAGGRDGTVRVWDVGTGEPVTILEGHRGAVWSVCAVAVAGRDLLASGGDDGTVRVWDLGTGKPVTILEGHQGWVYAVCPVTVAGRDLLASGGDDGTVRVWDLGTSKPVTILEGHQGAVWSLCAVAVAGRDLLASGGDDGTVWVWDLATGEPATILEGERSAVHAVCPVGRDLLAAGGEDGVVQVWDLGTDEPVTILEGDWGAVWPISVADRDLLAAGGEDGVVQVWDLATGEPATAFEDDQGWVNAVCTVTVAGQDLLAAAGAEDWGDGTVQVWDLATGEPVITLEGGSAGVNAVCPVTVAGWNLLASGGDDGKVRVWDLATGEPVITLQGHRGAVNAVCPVTVAGRDLLASGGDDGKVRVWDLATGEPVITLQGHRGAVNAVCPVTVAGRDLLAGGGGDGTVRVWDLATGEPVITLQGHRGWVYGVCPVTVAGRDLLAAGGRDGEAGTVRVWDLATGELVTTLEGHKGAVWSVCPVTVAGRDLLASGGDDGTVQVWDLATGASLASIPASYRVLALHGATTLIAVGLSAGVLVIKLNVDT